ncbi:MAG: hypothetical protein WDA25_05115 [Paracoccaceae bacterium]
MTPRLVIHVGPHKTATTYLQANFAAARTVLRQSGWLYPTLGRAPGTLAHHDLAHHPGDYLADPGALARLGQRAHRDGASVLLSAEGFVRWPRARFDQLAALMGFAGAELVYTLRDPVEGFVSYWAEEIKHGATASLPERMAAHFADPFASRLLNPMVTLRPWLAAPGLRLHALPFEQIRRRGADIFTHFCAAVLGLPDIVPVATTPANTRLALELTEFLRMLGQMHNTHAGDASLRMGFMRATDAQRRADIVALVRAEAAAGLRETCVPASAPFRRHIERATRAALQNRWTHDPGPGPLFAQTDTRCAWYADAALWASAPIRAAARDLSQRIAA